MQKTFEEGITLRPRSRIKYDACMHACLPVCVRAIACVHRGWDDLGVRKVQRNEHLSDSSMVAMALGGALAKSL